MIMLSLIQKSYICASLFNGRDNAIYLYLLGLAYYGNPEEYRFIEDCKKK